MELSKESWLVFYKHAARTGLQASSHANPKAAGMRRDFFYTFSNYGTYDQLTDDGLTQWHPAFLEMGSTTDECADRIGFPTFFGQPVAEHGVRDRCLRPVVELTVGDLLDFDDVVTHIGLDGTDDLAGFRAKHCGLDLRTQRRPVDHTHRTAGFFGSLVDRMVAREGREVLVGSDSSAGSRHEIAGYG